MTKNQKKHLNTKPTKKHPAELDNEESNFTNIKNWSKRMLHNYLIPMTRVLERRLQRLEQSL